MTEHRDRDFDGRSRRSTAGQPWTLILALTFILAGPIAVGVVGGVGGAIMLALAWGAAVGAFVVAVQGLPDRFRRRG